MRLPERLRRRPAAPVPALRVPRAAWLWIAPLALLIGAVVYAVARWLLTGLPPNPAGPDEVAARNEAVRTALTAGAGVGAAVTVMLAFRRQRHQELAAHLTTALADRNATLAERTAEATQHDATERRVTELYIKAVEQLGSDKAAVRLGGLYALERLAQDNRSQRQTIVNVICAYLRMPYTLPALPDPDQVRKQALRDARRRYYATRTARHAPTPRPAAPSTPVQDAEGERQVRLTAQRILADHLRDDRPIDQRHELPPPTRFWDNTSVDLTGATLINFDFRNCHTTEAQFERVAFSGDVTFSGAIFSGDATFDGASFSGDATFDGAIFTGVAWFDEASFSAVAGFNRTSFSGDATFNEATFSGVAWFDEASFSRDTWFDGAIFSGVTTFNEATFSRDATFTEASFSRDATFTKASFSRDAMFNVASFSGAGFNLAIFSGDAMFTKASFSGDATFNGASFGGAGFNGASFFGDATFTGAAFAGDAWFNKASFVENVWFSEATFSRDAGFTRASFSGDARFDRATFDTEVDVTDATVRDPARPHIWPPDWHVQILADGTGLLTRVTDPQQAEPAEAG
ncbi:hypothetical protein GCM10022226_55960 [Sphaerisporangium flaviroseum]|uniref:Pentapeptide repeat-containing protein n=1 Tax=Sphaerisporangium flaviroseum TaxID=509199 RepID=A0ABP7IWF0_9ACTN